MSSTFRRRNALHQWHLHFGPNMTPMVDVVMVILVFFMASTAFIGPEWLLRIGLADDAESDSGGFRLGPAELTVRLQIVDGTVRASGLGLEEALPDSLAARAAAAAESLGSALSETHIILEPDDAVAYDAVVRAQEIFVSAGFAHVAIR